MRITERTKSGVLMSVLSEAVLHKLWWVWAGLKHLINLCIWWDWQVSDKENNEKIVSEQINAQKEEIKGEKKRKLKLLRYQIRTFARSVEKYLLNMEWE